MRGSLVLFLTACLVWPAAAIASGAEPIRYAVAIREPSTQMADVRAVIPTSGDSKVELMMPVWSPGFYRVEDYAGKVSNLQAKGEDGVSLSVTQPRPNAWVVEAGKRERFVLTYGLLCDRRSVTTNEVAKDYAVLNAAGTFVVPRRAVHAARRPIDVVLELPAGWTVEAALPRQGAGFRAPDYETLVDSPILAGRLSVHEFNVNGSAHALVDAGEVGAFDGSKAANDLARIAAETRRFWGFLPYPRYLFLNVFRQGGGGLEHKDSTLLTANAARMATPASYLGWLDFVGHEYFHAFNVKRLRPVELGPFDFDHPPHTKSLWISEGLTTYFANLMVRRSGLSTRAEYLDGLSALIRNLQKQPGRLVQSVEQSSMEVWNNSMSGVNVSDSTVSYYVKGAVLGFVLDARIRRATYGRRSIDDLLRLAYKRYSGPHGFKPEQFQATASEVAGVDLSDWFRSTTASTEELDYGEALDWFGLRFVESPDPEKQWGLAVREGATPDQARRLDAWLGPR